MRNTPHSHKMNMTGESHQIVTVLVCYLNQFPGGILTTEELQHKVCYMRPYLSDIVQETREKLPEGEEETPVKKHTSSQTLNAYEYHLGLTLNMSMS